METFQGFPNNIIQQLKQNICKIMHYPEANNNTLSNDWTITLGHAWETRSERPKGVKDEVKQTRRAANEKLGSHRTPNPKAWRLSWPSNRRRVEASWKRPRQWWWRSSQKWPASSTPPGMSPPKITFILVDENVSISWKEIIADRPGDRSREE